jgi:Uma2 family endonuclease
MVTMSHTAQTLLRLPLREAGDHLDQATFHERYKAMPPAFRAELIGGVVIGPSPLSRGHRVYHALVMTWLGNYCIATPGTLPADNTTTMLGELSEPQPDGVLSSAPAAGGQTGLADDDYTTGPPELIVEVASSSASIDLHAKGRDYEHAGVLDTWWWSCASRSSGGSVCSMGPIKRACQTLLASAGRASFQGSGCLLTRWCSAMA